MPTPQRRPFRTIRRSAWLKRGEAQARYPHLGATKAVATEKRNGRMLPATSYMCAACNRRAMDYHHANYHAGNRLAVVPLCRSCHRKAHGKGLDATFGIVPTGIGIIRIAIAAVPT